MIAWIALLLTVLCVVLAVMTMRANGLLVLALIFAFTFTWAVGALTRAFWRELLSR